MDQATFLHANSLIQTGHYHQAIEILTSLANQFPQEAKIKINLAIAFRSIGETTKAQALLESAIQLQPSSHQAHNNLANIFIGQGNFLKAKPILEKALTLYPDYPAAWINLGTCYFQFRDFTSAINAYQQALSIEPHNTDALLNCAVTYLESNQPHQVLDLIDPSLHSQDLQPEINYLLGQAHSRLGNLALALQYFEISVNQDPNLGTNLEELVLLKMRTFSLHRLDYLINILSNRAHNLLATNEISPYSAFTDLHISPDLRHNLLIAQTFSRQFCHLTIAPRPLTHSHLKLGFLSGDLNNHPIGYQLQDFLTQSLPSAIDTQIFDYSPHDASPLRDKYLTTNHTDISAFSPQQIITSLDQSNSSVLIDLSGLTQRHRLAEFYHAKSYRKITYLGFTGTLGSPNCNFNLSDSTVIKPSDSVWYTETCTYLPHCYSAPAKIVSPRAPKPPELADLPKSSLILVNPNKNQKLSLNLVSIWKKTLLRFPQTYLWTFPNSQLDMEKLIVYFTDSAINKERLIFSPQIPINQHLARLRYADLALDSIRYSAGATCYQVLTTGLPILSHYGPTYISRMSSSMLLSANGSELITHSPQAYHHTLKTLVSQPLKLKRIRKKLVSSYDYPLYDLPRFTENFIHAISHIIDTPIKNRPNFIKVADPFPLQKSFESN